MERRKVVDAREARALLTRVARSGAQLAVWARAHGIDGRSLNAWRMNLARGRNPAARARGSTTPEIRKLPRLVELLPVELPRAPARARYSLRLGDAVLEFGDDANADTLRRVVAVLRAC